MALQCLKSFPFIFFFLFNLFSAIEEVNDMLSNSAGYREVHTMAWLSEQVHIGGDSSRTDWKPVFMALTDKDMLLYEAVPWSREDWSSPFMSHPLLATR